MLHTIWEYPANELWCIHCGNRYFASFASREYDSGAIEGHRVLLLDECADRRDELARHLARLGYQVTPVCHPRQALEAASFRRFDLMVLSSTTSADGCEDLVAKVRQLLGGIQFVVVAGKQSWISELRDPDIRCVAIGGSDDSQLEQALEPLLDELSAERVRRRSSPERGALASVS
jgi:CheY-like chemotaxis protein